MASASTLLTAVEAAIVAILADQNASVDVYGVQYTRLNLDKLFEIRDRLRAELARTSSRRFALSDRRADT